MVCAGGNKKFITLVSYDNANASSSYHDNESDIYSQSWPALKVIGHVRASVENSYDESPSLAGLRSLHTIASISRMNEEILLENVEWGYSKLCIFLSESCYPITGTAIMPVIIIL